MARNDRRDMIGVNFGNIGEARVKALLESGTKGGWNDDQIHEARTWLNEQEVSRAQWNGVRSWIAIAISVVALIVAIAAIVVQSRAHT